jgi:hypothetical protein
VDKNDALQLLRTITFQKTAGGLTAPVVGPAAPKLPVVGEGGTKQDQLLRSAGQNAQAQVETVQNRVVPATSNYSPAKGRNASGPSGIGQSFATVMAKQPKDKKLTQPPTQAKVAYVKQAAKRSSRALLNTLVSGTPPQAGIPAPQLTVPAPPVAPPAAPPAAAALRSSGAASKLPVAAGPWSYGTRIPEVTEVARLRKAVERYSAKGPADMGSKDMRYFLQGVNERPSGTGGRAASILGGPFLRYPSPPVYAPPAAGEAFANALTQAGTALGLQNKGMLRSAVNFAKGLGGSPGVPREVLAPAIKPGLLRNQEGDIAPVQALWRVAKPVAAAYGAAQAGKYLYDKVKGVPGTGQPTATATTKTETLTPEESKMLNDIRDRDSYKTKVDKLMSSQ